MRLSRDEPQCLGYDANGDLTNVDGAAQYRYDAFDRMVPPPALATTSTRKANGCARSGPSARASSPRTAAARCWGAHQRYLGRLPMDQRTPDRAHRGGRFTPSMPIR
ncbi:hypothetical protein [Luteibacter sp. CQ10]|uniref:hypothetical protein n=1 Tax=Luteibacter sp. CQ10 TaxID=2805821 RepID=UPI0034A13C8C